MKSENKSGALKDEMALKIQLACDELSKIVRMKNKKYGNSVHSTIDKYGDATILIRLTDKLKRLEAILLNGETSLDDERLIDTFLDLAGYSILGKIYYEEKGEN